MPPWLGVMGGALQTAANAYLKTLLDEPYDREKLEKAQLSNDLLREQIEQTRANTGWLNRRVSGRASGGRPIFRTLADGTIGVYDEDLRSFVPVPGSMARAPRALTPRQKWDDAQMQEIERLIGRPPPWSWQELQREDVRPHVDLLENVPQIYSGPTGFASADDIREHLKRLRQGQQPAPAPAPVPSPKAEAAPTTPPPIPSAVQAGVTEAERQQIDQELAKWAGIYNIRPELLRAVAKRESNFHPRARSKANAVGVMQLMPGTASDFGIQDADRTSIPLNIWAGSLYLRQMLDRYNGNEELALAAYNAGPGAVDRAGRKIPPIPQTQEYVREVLALAGSPAKDMTAGATSTGGGAAAPPRVASMDLPTAQTAGQREEAERKRRDQQIEEERNQREKEKLANEKERLGIERQREERADREEAAKRLRDKTGPVSKPQEMMTSMLFSQRLVSKPFYAELPAEEKELVNRRILEPARRKEEIAALKLAQPYLDELDAIDATAYLTGKIIPLLESGNLGFFGRTKDWWSWFTSLPPWTKSRYYREAEEELRKQGVTGALNDAMVKTRIAANIEQNPDEVKNSMTPIQPQAALETYASILAYIHAMTIKRTAGGSTRSIIQSDMNAAHKLFDPSLFFSSPDVMLTRLKSLQTYIQHPKDLLRDRVRSYHIDPDRRELIDFDISLPAVAPETSETEQDPGLESLRQRARSGKRP